MIVAFGPAPSAMANGSAVALLHHRMVCSVKLVLCASRHDSKELNTLHSTESNDHIADT